ncbi:MAG TPA: hypothetical protein VNJ01_18230 [Bacteriovoracaceae bacterium]|nr:hypothetical protein [Bacteriovoracaceae bacterium]
MKSILHTIFLLSLIMSMNAFSAVDGCSLNVVIDTDSVVPQKKIKFFEKEIAKAFKAIPEFELSEFANTDYEVTLRLGTFWDHHYGSTHADLSAMISKNGSPVLFDWHLGNVATDDQKALTYKNIRLVVKDLFKDTLKSCAHLRSKE